MACGLCQTGCFGIGKRTIDRYLVTVENPKKRKGLQLRRLVKEMKIKRLEDIYLFLLPIKKSEIIDFFLGSALKNKILNVGVGGGTASALGSEGLEFAFGSCVEPSHETLYFHRLSLPNC